MYAIALTSPMSDEEKQTIDAEFKRSELRWRSDIENDVKELVRLEQERAKKYDSFIDMLIKREQKRERLWDAVIDKGFTMLIIGAVVSLVSLAWNGALGELKAILHSKGNGK